VRVEVNPELLAWATERSGLDRVDLEAKFPKLDDWETGAAAPTLRQLESFAATTRTPVGYLFLTDPPEEQLPIPDFRTMGDQPLRRPSPDLLDTIYQCQQRQEWFRDYSLTNRLEVVPWVGSCTLEMDAVEVGATMRDVLNFAIDQRGPTWTDAFRKLGEHAENAGLLVMVSGVVGSNTRRQLQPSEFRGFALADPLAPIVFVNGADTRAAQIFTLAHEIAHIWLGQTGLDNVSLAVRAGDEVETWCNGVAAEFLVPLEDLREQYNADAELGEELNRLARRFKVSTLVIVRRLHEGQYLTRDQFRIAYRNELERVLDIANDQPGGGNFYNMQPIRVSKMFARAVISDTLSGSTTYSDAFRMLGLRKSSTFNSLAVFIRAKNDHYSFDMVPAFWDWSTGPTEMDSSSQFSAYAMN
jgi:Zn-dependent peptidase ImmA (M78 family)